MEQFAEFIFQHVHLAPYLIFAALMLAGLNLPISEDFMLILSGMLASTVVPDRAFDLFLWTFLGCYLSDWESYWLGRGLGVRLFQVPWLRQRSYQRRVRQVRAFYRRYGMWTLLIGRFIPFGVRNFLFMSAGLGRMPFLKFILADGVACLISNSILFSLAYSFGKNYEVLRELVSVFNAVLFVLFLGLLGAGILFLRRRQGLSSVGYKPGL